MPVAAGGQDEGLGESHDTEHPQEAPLAQRDHVLHGQVGDGQQRHRDAEQQQRVGGQREIGAEGEAQQQLGRDREDQQRRARRPDRDDRERAQQHAAAGSRPAAARRVASGSRCRPMPMATHTTALAATAAAA